MYLSLIEHEKYLYWQYTLMMNMTTMRHGNVILFVVMIKWCIMIMANAWWWYINVLTERAWSWPIFMVFDRPIRTGHGPTVIHDSYLRPCHNSLNMTTIIIARIPPHLELLSKFAEFPLHLRWLSKYACLVL